MPDRPALNGERAVAVFAEWVTRDGNRDVVESAAVADLVRRGAE